LEPPDRDPIQRHPAVHWLIRFEFFKDEEKAKREKEREREREREKEDVAEFAESERERTA
jgi:hypothetical protein